MKELLENDNAQLIQSDYVWPISKGVDPDEMNTSFGPRIKNDIWHFHKGIDLPQPCYTKVYAMHAGKIHQAGPKDNNYGSTHVVIEVPDHGKTIFLVYLHLSKIADNIMVGMNVETGQYIGNVGMEDATYCHLHVEIRVSTNTGDHSVHPLEYLPYSNTVNFNNQITSKLQSSGLGSMKARLFFTAADKNEGDLKKVEVALLKNGSIIDEPKIVDFDDPQTIKKTDANSDANSDNLIFNKQGIGVEGYQKSDMGLQGYSDLHYGILIQNIPADCDSLSAKVYDVGGNVNVSSIAISRPSSFEQILDFEDGLMPPTAWRVKKIITFNNINDTSAEPHVSIENQSAYSGKFGMLCRISKSTRSGSYAAIEYTLPEDEYFELLVEAMVNPFKLELNKGNSIYPIYFINDQNRLSVAAAIYKNPNSSIQARLVARDAQNIKHSNNNGDDTNIDIQEWRIWRLVLRRIDTRQTTVTLDLGNENNSTYYEAARMNYDSRLFNPTKLRIGIGFCSPEASGTIFCDDIMLTGNLDT